MSEDRIPLHRPSLGDEENAALQAVLASGWLTTGEQCARFEEEFAAFVGVPFALAVNSCTAALHLAVEALGVRRGDRVLVPALTFAATAEAVLYRDATPVLVDCEPDTLTVDPEAIRVVLERLVAGASVPGATAGPPAVAVMPMHYAGQLADVDAIRVLAERYRLKLIEDAAHALPAESRDASGRWRSVGATADATCFSFYATKTITTGEGGMLVTADANVAELARRLSLHGLSNDAWSRYSVGGGWSYRILSTGYKYNMTDLAAALGRAQLRKARDLAAKRARIAQRYRDGLGDLEEVELPFVRPDRRPAWHLYAMRLRRERLAGDRDEFMHALRARGIGASVHWMPLHLHPFYRERFGYRPEHFPVATREWQRLVSLPIFPGMTEREIERVIAAVRELAARFRRRLVAVG